MPDIRLITLDLDGTLLNSKKELSPENAAALQWAADQGIEIVPTTGRFYGGMPEVIRNLPYLHYAITINGAQVYDVRNDAGIAKAEIPVEKAVALMSWLDQFPVIYDCFMDNWGWMTRSLQEKADEFAPNEHYAKMLKELRTPVDELKAFLTERGHDIQKSQFFAKDMDLRAKLMEEIPQRFPDLIVSSAVVNNVEINDKNAHKGNAIRQLAQHLGLDMSQVLAFGDGSNDITMLQAAGVGVCMANGLDSVKAIADYVTDSCDEDGVAKAIYRFCK
jgi:Cof subfamily protein (haloacid dehalogenase superfamily)